MNIDLILNKIDRNKNYIILVPILVFAVLIRLKLLLLNTSYGQDACALASSLRMPFSQLFIQLNYFQVSPPFFMAVSKFILSLSGTHSSLEFNDFILRIFPFLCSIGSIFLFYSVLKKIYPNNFFIYFCLFLFAFNPIAITYSTQFKQYGTEILVSLIIFNMYYFLDIKSITNKKLLLIALFTAVSPWFNHCIFIIFPACFVIILADIIKNKYFDLKKFLILLLPVLISTYIFISYYYLPLKESYYAPMGDDAKEYFMYMNKYLSSFWEGENPSFFTWDNFIPLFQYKMENMLSFHLPNCGYLILFILNIFILLYNKNYKLTCLIIVPALITIMLSFFKMFPFEPRIISFLIPLIIILYCQFILAVKKELTSKVIIAVIFVYLFCINYVMPIERYYQLSDYFNHRNVLKELKKLNPNLDNVISNSIMTDWYIKTDLKCNDSGMLNEFKNSLTFNYLKDEAELGEYWIAGVMNCPEYKNGLFSFLNENKEHYKIIDLYLYNGTDNFIAHIRKNN